MQQRKTEKKKWTSNRASSSFKSVFSCSVDSTSRSARDRSSLRWSFSSVLWGDISPLLTAQWGVISLALSTPWGDICLPVSAPWGDICLPMSEPWGDKCPALLALSGDTCPRRATTTVKSDWMFCRIAATSLRLYTGQPSSSSNLQTPHKTLQNHLYICKLVVSTYNIQSIKCSSQVEIF